MFKWIDAMRQGLLLILILFATAAVYASSLADDDAPTDKRQVFHVSDDIDLVPTLKIFYDKPRIVVRAVFPQLESMEENTEALDEFNQEVMDFVQQQISGFKRAVQVLYKATPKARNDLFIDYDTSVVKSGKHRIISIRFIMQTYITGNAKPTHFYRVLNYDLVNAQKIELSDLFQENANYLQVLADYSQKYLLKFLHKKLFLDGLAPRAENFRNWNLKAGGLLITFEGAQFAPFASRTQTILIPYAILRPMLSPTSPIARCIKQKKWCVHSDLLTGGFIDDAFNAPHGRLNPIFSLR